MLNKVSRKIGSRGVTLVEVMISLVILLIVFMGLIQASLLSINHNLRNEARDEAVRVAANSMGLLKSFNYSCGELNAPPVPPTNTPLIQGTYTNCGYDPANASFVAGLPSMNNPRGNFRNLRITYAVTKGVDVIDANTKRLTVVVQWQYPGDTDTQSHTIYYTMRNPVQ